MLSAVLVVGVLVCRWLVLSAVDLVLRVQGREITSLCFKESMNKLCSRDLQPSGTQTSPASTKWCVHSVQQHCMHSCTALHMPYSLELAV